MISIIIPAYNESENLKISVPLLEKHLKGSDHMLMIVDDGSTDSTEETARSFASDNRRIKVISYDKNKGRGFAVRQGISNSAGNVFMMDVDLASSIDMRIIKKMSDELRSSDVVIASRFMPGSRIRRKPHRAMLSAVYRKLVKLVFPGLRVSDTDSGLKAFRKDAAMAIAEATEENRWSWDLESVVFARKRGWKIKEIPLKWEESSGSSVNVFTCSAEQLAGILKMRMRHGKI